jgi:intraflagellar transport protein 122
MFVVAVGDRVLLYESAGYALKKSLRGHTGLVYCLAFSKDGKRFASGGSDKRVVTWFANGEGEKKYTHNTSIQCLSYNPLLQTVSQAPKKGSW